MPLIKSRKKLPEPLVFVIQKHRATHLHYDLRLQIGTTLKSWAIPKLPPRKIGVKRLAILVKDHPLSYAKFEGEIPKGSYGAGSVEVWDTGSYTSLKEESMHTSFQNGTIEIVIRGNKLNGRYILTHMRDKQWLFFKARIK